LSFNSLNTKFKTQVVITNKKPIIIKVTNIVYQEFCLCSFIFFYLVFINLSLRVVWNFILEFFIKFAFVPFLVAGLIVNFITNLFVFSHKTLKFISSNATQEFVSLLGKTQSSFTKKQLFFSCKHCDK
jgi:hypothetical protein